ncbi:DUF7535 family protein [Natronobacterium gregoryi]|uniref:Uncharacterized protein n=2 Tax=Natronobacterium gregoryi TaxID=44930 RepID=L0AIC1_NATGS|nr:hypothetical protein [Natronobacterium gregoryi]AFZ73618.1 hypothetical protein Natgr_2453 [Natronobacterium gregoryi SP2]ELY67901.1 hypothetical protein C490_10415 [Natronobacterium gregoryi SP2]PLK19992.1 hypothetical protein CYV19_11780 [Natronobacterium gregoryi SP2]SFJ34162.1 hypothetical protein SAMN05443661_12319 [Natronobacterium gregoryi]
MSTKVSESTGYVPNGQMSAFGYVIAAVLVVVMLPLLPVIAVVWLLWRVFVSADEEESSYANWRNDPERRRLEPPFEEEVVEDEDEDEDEDETEAEAEA